VLVTPSNAEFHQFDWESRQQEDYLQIKERDIQKLEIEYERGQQSLRALSHELQETLGNSDVKLRQIKKLSELIHPIERDVTYIIRDADSHHVFNSYNSHNDSIDNDSKYSKLVKDGDTFEWERKVNDLMTRVSAQGVSTETDSYRRTSFVSQRSTLQNYEVRTHNKNTNTKQAIN